MLTAVWSSNFIYLVCVSTTVGSQKTSDRQSNAHIVQQPSQRDECKAERLHDYVLERAKCKTTSDLMTVRPFEGIESKFNSDLKSNFRYQILQPGKRRNSQPQDLSMWMLIEFLKVAPLFMGVGCIVTILCAMWQKYINLAQCEARSKIKWTKPAGL